MFVSRCNQIYTFSYEKPSKGLRSKRFLIYGIILVLKVSYRISYLRNPNFDFVRKNTSFKSFFNAVLQLYALFSLLGLLFSSILRSSDLSRNAYEKVLYEKRMLVNSCLFGNGHPCFSSKSFLNFGRSRTKFLIKWFLTKRRVLVEFIKYKMYAKKFTNLPFYKTFSTQNLD